MPGGKTYQACEPMADDGLTGCNYTCEQQVIAQQLSTGEQGVDRTVSTPTSSNNMLRFLAFSYDPLMIILYIIIGGKENKKALQNNAHST